MIRTLALRVLGCTFLAPSGALGPARSWHVTLDRQLETIPAGTPLLIDGDNVRGKSAFAWGQAALIDRVQLLHNNLAARTQLHFDHGASKDAFCTNNLRNTSSLSIGSTNTSGTPLCVVFSGPEASADDIICRDVRWWCEYT